MLSLAIAFERLEPVRRRRIQITQCVGAIQHVEFAKRGIATPALAFPAHRPEPKTLRGAVAEMQNHLNMCRYTPHV